MSGRDASTQLFYRPYEKISVWPAIAARGKENHNIYVVDLPKAGRSVVRGDATFIFACAFLEPDTEVATYVVDSDRLTDLAERADIPRNDVTAKIQYTDGRWEWCKVVAGLDAAAPEKIPGWARSNEYRVVALGDYPNWQVRFDNWLTLCRWIACTRGLDLAPQTIQIQDLLDLHTSVTLGELLRASDDQGLVLAAVAWLLHGGLAEANLSGELLSPSTIITWRSEGDLYGPAAVQSRRMSAEIKSSLAHPIAVEKNPRRGRPRTLGSGEINTNVWPEPNVEGMPDRVQRMYLKRKEAVLLYLGNVPCRRIETQCGITLRRTRTLLKRCLTADEAGRLYGYFGLLPHFRLHRYRREAPVDANLSLKSRGCAGALSQLLRRMPDVKDWLDERIIAAPKRNATTIDRWVDLRDAFLEKLLEQGVTDRDWPFCRRNRAYQALRTYARGLLVDSQPQAQGRSARAPLIRALRPLSILQMDYQVAGAACVLRLKNAKGDVVRVPVHRWYLGIVGDEELQAVAGVSVEFEVSPSADAALEAISSVIDPSNDESYRDHLRYTADGKFLLRHFFPQLGWHGFSMLRVDNGWCNKAHDVVNNLIDTVGCAVQFGPPYRWWVRDVIERVIGQLDALGLSRLPGTYGTGPNDKRRRAPEEKAVDLEVNLNEILDVIYGAIAKFNLAPSERHQHSSRVAALKAALIQSEVGCFIQPLPKATQRRNSLLEHVERRVVRGGRNLRERPYVKVDRCRYVCDQFAEHLVGRSVWVYINRRDARFGRAVLCETGRNLGHIEATGGWAKTPVSWRRRRLINRGITVAQQQVANDPVRQWEQEKCQEILAHKNRHKTRKTALTLLAHGKSKQGRGGSTKAKSIASELGHVVQGAKPKRDDAATADPFGLRSTPKLDGS
ncbi:hypothetical protein [Ralstonia pseudosolanacearum]|uniref:hypothetical protein n=1 Tax=Ralstonia pseudosolanacearum TaxID=1310165 RepID=UPI003CF321EC